MKYLAILFVLFPMVIFAQGGASGPPTSPTGFAYPNCDNKCEQNQKCTMDMQTRRYYCMSYNNVPQGIVAIDCKTIGGTPMKQCPFSHIMVTSLDGVIPVTGRPQCCIAKSKFKVR